MKVTIYHNPRCSKSRQALQLLNDRGIQPEIVEYLKNPPDTAQIDSLLTQLHLQPRDLMRQKEAEYQQLNLSDPSLSHEQLLSAMHETPKLIERPIVVVEDKGISKAAVGRPLENVEAILS